MSFAYVQSSHAATAGPGDTCQVQTSAKAEAAPTVPSTHFSTRTGPLAAKGFLGGFSGQWRGGCTVTKQPTIKSRQQISAEVQELKQVTMELRER